MHIPDGFLTPPVWVTLDAAAVPAISYLARRARTEIEDSRIPLLGVMGAFVFAAQMINFPVGLGTSGHLVGGALLACLLGPAPAAMVMTAILAIQALVFQDGGILALGANVLNMAVFGVFVGYLPYRYFAARHRRAAIFAGAFLSVSVSASMALSELLLSGVRMGTGIILVSLALFAASAIIEGLITVAAIEAIERLHPSWVRSNESTGTPAFAAVGVAAILLASFGVVFASASPDGIWKLAEQTGIASRAASLVETPFSGYSLQGISNSWMAKAGAGVAGVLLIFGVTLALGRLSRRRHVVGAERKGA